MNDPVRLLILRRASEMGRDLKSLSLEIGMNHAYLQQFIHRGVPKRLPEDARNKLAKAISVEPNDLRNVDSTAETETRDTARNAVVGGSVALRGTIPVYGHAVGGKDGQFVLNGNKVADILAPPSLSGIPEAYAVYVVGDSMEERYFAGEVVFVNPRLPVRQGNFVVAQVRETGGAHGEAPSAYVKRFISMDDKRLRLEQTNPKKYLDFPRERVVSVHRIIMGGEG